MRIKVEYLDGTTAEAVVGARAEVEVERRFDIGFAEAFGSGSRRSRLDYFYAMCWAALKYSGQDIADYDVWLELVEDAEQVDEPKESTPDPTRRARRPAKSSS